MVIAVVLGTIDQPYAALLSASAASHTVGVELASVTRFTTYLPYAIRNARYIDSTIARCTVLHERDSNSDSRLDGITLFEQDTLTTLSDRDGDRLVDSYILTIIDEAARHERLAHYDVTGRTLLSATEYTYDAQNRLMSWQVDSDGDSVFDLAQYYAYDSRGNEVEIKYDEDGNGEIDVRESSDYDDRDRWIFSRYDNEDDGTWDTFSSGRWIDEANVETEIFDRGDDGVIDWVMRTTYDDQDRPISKDSDRNGHKYPVDEWEERVEWDYDEAGRTIQRRLFMDGAIHDLDTMEYDAFGRMLVRRSRRGPIRGIETWTYSCDP